VSKEIARRAKGGASATPGESVGENVEGKKSRLFRAGTPCELSRSGDVGKWTSEGTKIRIFFESLRLACGHTGGGSADCYETCMLRERGIGGAVDEQDLRT